MTPCEEAILETIHRMSDDRGEAVSISAISRQSYVSLRHARRCVRVIEVELNLIVRFTEPGKPARLVIKLREN